MNIIGITLQGTVTPIMITCLVIMNIPVTPDQVTGRFQEISPFVLPQDTAQDLTSIRVIGPARSTVTILITDTALPTIAAIITLADLHQIIMATQCHILVAVLPMYIVTSLILRLLLLRPAILPCPLIITFPI